MQNSVIWIIILNIMCHALNPSTAHVCCKKRRFTCLNNVYDNNKGLLWYHWCGDSVIIHFTSLLLCSCTKTEIRSKWEGLKIITNRLNACIVNSFPSNTDPILFNLAHRHMHLKGYWKLSEWLVFCSGRELPCFSKQRTSDHFVTFSTLKPQTMLMICKWFLHYFYQQTRKLVQIFLSHTFPLDIYTNNRIHQ